MLFHRIKNRLVKKEAKVLPFIGQRKISDTEDHDIFIIGFPKSGNTWMQHIISHLYYHLNGNQSRSIINMIVPDVYANSHYLRLSDVAFFKSHDLPKPHHKKVIYIVRDGRDALLSYYHMQKNRSHDVQLKDFFSKEAKLFPSLWHEHVEAWTENPNNANILYIKYEDLIYKNHETIKTIGQFINASNLSQDFINYVSEETSFDSMRNVEKHDNAWKESKKKSKIKEGAFFVRKGKVGEYATDVPEELIQHFNSFSKKALLQFDYTE